MPVLLRRTLPALVTIAFALSLSLSPLRSEAHRSSSFGAKTVVHRTVLHFHNLFARYVYSSAVGFSNLAI